MLWTTLAAVFCCCSLSALGQYTAPYVGITGTLGSANGMPASNYGITLVPTQVMYVGGTSVVVGNANCSTDTNGNVVGVANPTGPAVLAPITGTGTLPIGNYFVEVTWYDAFGHQTLPSPEVQVQLTTAGSIQISPPTAGAPLSALGMRVYIGTSSGTETYQGQTTNPASTYTQAAALNAGAGLPIVNNTVCVVVANDAAWPIAGYMFNLTTPAGNNVPGFPQQVQFISPGSAYNISSGLPLFNGRVTYPVPILTLPYNHNPQSISGSLSMTGYNIYSVGRLGVGTALPAWGVDVEGAGQAAMINANSGYLVDGNGGTIGSCLGSDGTAYNTPVACLSSLPTLFYQTAKTNGTAMPQRSALNFSPYFVLSDSTSPSQTNVTLNLTGPGAKVASAAAAGVAGNCTNWDGAGNVGDAGGPCALGPSSLTPNGYQQLGSGLIFEWATGTSQSDSSVTQTVPFPLTCPNGVFKVIPGTVTSVFEDTHMGVFVLVSNTNSNATVAMQRVPDHSYQPATPTIWVVCH